MATDTTSSIFIFFKSLLTEFPERVSSNDKISDYYPVESLSPGDTIVLDREFLLVWIGNDSFILYVYMLYENELNQIYETYYWVRFIHKPVMRRKVLSPDRTKIYTQVLASDMEKMIQFVDQQNNSTKY